MHGASPTNGDGRSDAKSDGRCDSSGSSPADTRLLVATEGVLTARLESDPLLTDFRTVVLDEFHERSIHADLGLALTRQAWRARDDLAIVVMSATLDAERVAAYLDGCPIVTVPGRLHPVEISYRPAVAIEQAIRDARPQTSGALLCFLPGAPEIRRAAERLDFPAFALHGGLDSDEQDAALRPSAEPRVILATNIAETTLTVPDVVGVIDSGLQKTARFDPGRGIDSLEIERVSQDSADQRAGRAGRVRPGFAIRLWDSRDRLRPHADPEIQRVDLAATCLSVLAWGGDPRTLEWFDRPADEAMDAALALLARLGAIDNGGRLTPLGRDLQHLPLHPRLGRILTEARGAPAAARACALLSERHFTPIPRDRSATACDLLAAVDRESTLPPHVVRVAREIRDIYARTTNTKPAERTDDVEFRHAVLAGYPDRVAWRRAPKTDRLLLASGTGARLGRESGVFDAEFLVAVDVTAGVQPGQDALVRLATGIEKDWLAPTATTMRHELTDNGVVRAWAVDRYDALTLTERPASVDSLEAEKLLVAARLKRGPTEEDEQLIARLRFAGVDTAFETLVRDAVLGARSIADVDLGAHLSPEARRTLERHAPQTLKLPGRTVRLNYSPDGRVRAATRLQDLFGVTDTPRLGPQRVPVTFELLAPNGRPVQVTSDFASFWARVPGDTHCPPRSVPKHKW